VTRDFRLPDAVRNPVSIIGMAVATTMAVLFLVLLLLELAGLLQNPYIGLVLFVALPVLFIAGLLLIPIGGWAGVRRRRLHPEAAEWPVIDLRVPRQRQIAIAVVALTIVNLVIVSLAAYGGVHYMDSSQFCGQICHTTMEPEYVGAQHWPHAHVECAQCHVGPDVGAFVQAKLSGTRQLYKVVTNTVPKPVPPPAHLIRPARDTCERCHWPEEMHGDVTKVIREYANDEQNTESTTTIRLHVGGGSARLGVGTGIHWHMNLDNTVEFVAIVDAKGEQTIPYVRLTDQRGRVREFYGEGVTRAQIAGRPVERMDCMDCHNRPAHTFDYTAQRAVDTAMALGRLPRELPYLRREAVAAVSAEYPDRAAGLQAIATRLTDFYRSRPDIDRRLVQRAIATAQDVWQANVFPAMHVTWGTYPNNLGHVDTPGCFRCHDDSHKSADGMVISQDCELCHTAPE
jgi:nitrate/TMAO reductase-like tetraheme cytochrome c subunit